MERIPYFDLCAILILIFMLVASIFRRMTKGIINRYYIDVVVISVAATVFDIFSIYIDNAAIPGLHFFSVIMHTGYLFMHNITTPFYVVYIIAHTDTFHKFGKLHPETCFVIIPSFIYAAILAANIFTGWIFYIDDDCVYHRGPYMIVFYMLAFAFCLFSVIYLFIYRRLFNIKRFIALLSIFPALGAAVIVQFIFPHIRIEMFAVALMLIFIAMFIHRPEEFIDYETGLNKFSAYAYDMRKRFSTDKPMDVIMINISNYLPLQELLSYDNINDLLKVVAGRLSIICRTAKTEAYIYYLDKGRFRIVLSGSDRNNTNYIAETVNAALKPKIPINNMELTLLAYVCIAHCPDEINDFDMIITFGKDLSSKFPYTGKVMFAKNLLENTRYDLVGELESIIERAADENRFEVYYQPIYSVNERRFSVRRRLLSVSGTRNTALFLPSCSYPQPKRTVLY